MARVSLSWAVFFSFSFKNTPKKIPGLAYNCLFQEHKSNLFISPSNSLHKILFSLLFCVSLKICEIKKIGVLEKPRPNGRQALE